MGVISIIRSIEEAVNINSKDIALIEDDNKITYSQLNGKINFLSEWLKSENVHNVRNIVLCLRSGIDYLSLILTGAKDGLNVILSGMQIRITTFNSIIDKYNECIFITNKENYNYIKSLASNLNGIKVIVIPESKIKCYKSYNIIFSQGASIVFSSSGTTSPIPKLIRIPFESLEVKLNTISKLIPISQNDKNLLVSPLCFIQAIWVTLIHLLNGATVIFKNFSATKISDYFESYGVTTFSATPSIIRGILEHITNNKLRLLLIGGDFLDQETIYKIQERFPKTLLSNIYGCTETAAADIILIPTLINIGDSTVFSIGKPTDISKVKILNDDNIETQQGEVGELYIKSPCVIKNYVGDETSLLDNDGYFPTGDIAYRNMEGYIFYKGRKKALIKYNGIKISPIEIEQCIIKSGMVKEALVVGEKDSLYGEIISAYVVPKDTKLNKLDIVEYLTQYLEVYKIPKKIKFVEELSKTDSGKLIRYRK